MGIWVIILLLVTWFSSEVFGVNTRSKKWSKKTQATTCVACSGDDIGPLDLLFKQSEQIIANTPRAKSTNAPAAKSTPKPFEFTGLQALVDVAKRVTLTAAEAPRMCWTAVMNHLREAGLVGRNKRGSVIAVGGGMADAELATLDFVNLLGPGRMLAGKANPCLAPPGSVLVYSGGQIRSANGIVRNCDGGPCGHVEVKIGASGKGDVASDYKSNVPVTGGCFSSGRGFQLKAIMVPRRSIIK